MRLRPAAEWAAFHVLVAAWLAAAYLGAPWAARWGVRLLTWMFP